MPIGPSDEVWSTLYEELAKLARSCGGTFAFVIDEGNGLWCVGLADSPPTTATHHEDRAADRFYRDELVSRAHDMRRGARFEIVKTDGEDRYVAISFAGIYAVVVWFGTDTSIDRDLVPARIRRALPRIEALTLGLPPLGGPEGDEGAGKQRA